MPDMGRILKLCGKLRETTFYIASAASFIKALTTGHICAAYDYAAAAQTNTDGLELTFAVIVLCIIMLIVIRLGVFFCGECKKTEETGEKNPDAAAGNKVCRALTVTTGSRALAVIPEPDELSLVTADNADIDISRYINGLVEMRKRITNYRFEEILDISNSFDKAVLSLIKINEESISRDTRIADVINGYYGSLKKVYRLAKVIDELNRR
jgi:hypothetical protein